MSMGEQSTISQVLSKARIQEEVWILSYDVTRANETIWNLEASCVTVRLVTSALMTSGLDYTRQNCSKNYQFMCAVEVEPPVRRAITILPIDRIKRVTRTSAGVWMETPDGQVFCHCEITKVCPTKNTCRVKVKKCLPDFYGPFCQYRDLAGKNAALTSSLPVATDYDVTTCNTDNKMVSASITFREPKYFTWMRVTEKKTGQKARGFELQFESKKKLHDCWDLSHVYVVQPATDLNVVDLVCTPVPPYVDRVILMWEGPKNICSINISGGRNTALLQKSFQIGNRETAAAVDGNAATCTPHADHSAPLNFLITYSSPYLLHELIVYPPQGHNVELSLQFLTEKDESIGTMNGITSHKGSVEFKLKQRLRVHKFRLSSTQQVLICELEAFGDCAPPHYSEYCNQTCPSGCRGQACHYNGLCYGCEFKSQDPMCGGASIDGNVTSTPRPDAPPDKWAFFNSTLGTFLIYLLILGLCMAGLFCCTCPCRKKKSKKRKAKLHTGHHRGSLASPVGQAGSPTVQNIQSKATTTLTEATSSITSSNVSSSSATTA
ncbi:uncharacterized protein LOC131943485 [Physella acuta]|uniref:uncharacterized protein LOC131943485 n=1 Tax=Physella acuta TaxID=109671 RepID=UPI0027DD829B|nr:uncharacterized protein LOC131943485 [Physella acuta]